MCSTGKMRLICRMSKCWACFGIEWNRSKRMSSIVSKDSFRRKSSIVERFSDQIDAKKVELSMRANRNLFSSAGAVASGRMGWTDSKVMKQVGNTRPSTLQTLGMKSYIPCCRLPLLLPMMLQQLLVLSSKKSQNRSIHCALTRRPFARFFNESINLCVQNNMSKDET